MPRNVEILKRLKPDAMKLCGYGPNRPPFAQMATDGLGAAGFSPSMACGLGTPATISRTKPNSNLRRSVRRQSDPCRSLLAIPREAQIRHTPVFRGQDHARSLPLGVDIARGSRYMPYAILRQAFLSTRNWGLWRANFRASSLQNRPNTSAPF
jgi:hypothetical protein